MIEVKEFIQRREKLISKLEDNSLSIVYSGMPIKSSADEDFDFIVNRNFLYLTNIHEEGCMLMIKKSGGIVKETLFILPFDPLVEKWTGKRLTAEEGTALSGVTNILYSTQFESELDSELKSGKYEKVYFDLEEELKIGKNLTTISMKEKVENTFKNIKVLDIYPLIVRLRMVKSDAEIEEFKKAIEKTNNALMTTVKRVKEGLYEYQLAATFFYELQNYDRSELSFPTIASSGVNATCLHYTAGAGLLKNSDMILFDLGGRHNTYCADISRTFPISGKFSPLQKTIYEIVLNCNKYMIEKVIKPGLSLKEINLAAREFLATECVKANLIETKEDIDKVYYHSVSHSIGLDTHDPFVGSDPSINYRDVKLEERNIISDEPGLYFKELNIGVRIEDDILVTKNGAICLSSSIIKEVKDIEEFMKGVK